LCASCGSPSSAGLSGSPGSCYGARATSQAESGSGARVSAHGHACVCVCGWVGVRVCARACVCADALCTLPPVSRISSTASAPWPCAAPSRRSCFRGRGPLAGFFHGTVARQSPPAHPKRWRMRQRPAECLSAPSPGRSRAALPGTLPCSFKRQSHELVGAIFLRPYTFPVPKTKLIQI